MEGDGQGGPSPDFLESFGVSLQLPVIELAELSPQPR
jgi:hypothetical protein